MPIGQPIRNTNFYLVKVDDPFSLIDVPGEEGELYIGGDGVSEGYLFAPELTEEKFVKNYFSGMVSVI